MTEVEGEGALENGKMRFARGLARPWRPEARLDGEDALRATRRRHGEAGFTLVEMLVVITIIGLIMGLVGPRVLNYLSESKVKAATIQIESLDGALDLYFLDLGRYPTTAQGLAALVQRPGGASAWNGPYLKNGNVPNDPWGRAYIYRSPSDHGAYEIVSLGSSGQEGGTGNAAAIKSWEIGATKKAQQ
jgi:general secretion pathway protein G